MSLKSDILSKKVHIHKQMTCFAVLAAVEFLFRGRPEIKLNI